MSTLEQKVEDFTPMTLFEEFIYYFKQNKGAMFGLALVSIFVLIAIFAPLLAPYDPSFIHDNSYRVSPFWSEGGSTVFILGTDDVGRDLLSRLIYGARISMGVGFLVMVFSLLFGTAIGLFSGYKGGVIDQLIMRGVDILLSLPSILLAIVVVAVLGPGLLNAVIAVSIVKVPYFIRLVRSSVLIEKKKDYVTASKSFGAKGFRQAVINIFPNCLAPIIIQGTLAFSDGILDVAALGFLGLGAQAPMAEWGTMLSDARAFLESSPWLVTFPGLCILIVVLGFNLLGDGLRDAFDPKLKK